MQTSAKGATDGRKQDSNALLVWLLAHRHAVFFNYRHANCGVKCRPDKMRPYDRVVAPISLVASSEEYYAHYRS